MKTIFDQLEPKAIDAILAQTKRRPAAVGNVLKHLIDPNYQTWTELPYYIVKTIYEMVYGMGEMEEDEFRALFKNFNELP